MWIETEIVSSVHESHALYCVTHYAFKPACLWGVGVKCVHATKWCWTFSAHHIHPLKFPGAYSCVSGKMPSHTCFIQLWSVQCVPCVKHFSGLRKQMNQAGPCSWELLGYFRNGLMNRYSQCNLTRADKEKYNAWQEHWWWWWWSCLGKLGKIRSI